MQQYKDLITDILENGSWQDNRTGIRTISLPGAMMRFNLETDGFPALTLKHLPFKSVVAELCGFLRGHSNAADFRALGCKVWDQNANENKDWLANPFRKGEDDLGPIYGVQWRSWPAYKLIDFYSRAQIEVAEANGYRLLDETGEGNTGLHRKLELLMYKEIDQLHDCLYKIINNPTNRRILFHSWNPAILDEVALPACHLLYQFFPNPTTRKLSMLVYLRSNDVGLGTPYNGAQSAALLSLVARITGYTPHILTYTIGDAHIYANHLDMITEMLSRESLPLSKLVINERVQPTPDSITHWLDNVETSDFVLENYVSHPSIKAPMAV